MGVVVRRVLLSLAVMSPIMAAVPPAAGAAPDDCPDPALLGVPGAEHSQAVCLEDLTTQSNPRTDTGAATGAGVAGGAQAARDSRHLASGSARPRVGITTEIGTRRNGPKATTPRRRRPGRVRRRG